MTELFLEIVNMSISASYLVLAVTALRLLLKKAPKWVNVLLWGLVAIRLVCPFTLESALSLIPSTEVIAPEIMLDATPEIHTGIESVNRVVNPVITEAFAPEPIASVNPLQIWIPVLSILWCIGMGMMLLYTLVTYCHLHHRVRMAIRVTGNIYLSEYVTSPFVLGIWKPRIYLPYHMNESDRCYVIAHERAHIRRKDHLWKPLGFLLLTLHWFNPVLWLAYVLLCRDIELACDEKVVKELGTEQRADYSQALLHCSITHRSIAACPLAFGEVGVKQRVKNVLNYKKPAFWVILICLVIVAVVSVCFLTDPVHEENDPGYGLIQQVATQDGYTITSQENKIVNLVLEKDKLPAACFTENGYTFEVCEVIPYETGTSNRLYLQHASLDEVDPTYVRFTFAFQTNALGATGKLLLPYRVDTDSNSFVYDISGRNEVWDNQTTYPDSAHFEPTANGEGFCLLVKADVCQKAVHHIAFMVKHMNLLSYEIKKLVPPVSISLDNISATGLTMLFHQDASAIDGPLKVSNDYFLEENVDGEWLEVPPLIQPKFREDALDVSTLHHYGIDWTGLYGALPDGNYRIAKPVPISSDSDERAVLYAEFTLPASEWPVSMHIRYVNRTGAFLEFPQTDVLPNGELCFTDSYVLERYTGNVWAEVPALSEKRALDAAVYPVEVDSVSWDQIDWTEDYGRLPDGYYRIKKTITLSLEPGNTINRDYYAEFSIGGTAQDYLTLALEDITPTGATLYLQETVDDPMSLIYNGNEGFWLECRQDGQWTYLEPTAYIEPLFADEPRYVHALHYSSGHMELDWSNHHGELPAGTYRIAREVTCTTESVPRLLTAYAEFTIGSSWGIDLLVDKLSDSSLTVSFLLGDTTADGEYFFAGATLQIRDRTGHWENILPLPEEIVPREDALSSMSALELLWDTKLHELSEGQYRVGTRIRRVLPDGTEEFNILYEYFDPSTYAWGASINITEVLQAEDSLRITVAHNGSKRLPEGSLTMSHSFRLEKRVNNHWEDMGPPLMEIPDTQHPIVCGQNYETEFIRLSSYFAPLPAGTYRLVKDVTRYYSDGTTETRPVYAVFTADTNTETIDN